MGSKMPEVPVSPGISLFTGWNSRQTAPARPSPPKPLSPPTSPSMRSGSPVTICSASPSTALPPSSTRRATPHRQVGPRDRPDPPWPPCSPSPTGAACTPASGAAVDFTSPVAYTVTAGDGTAQVWTVAITAAAGAGDNAVVTFEGERRRARPGRPHRGQGAPCWPSLSTA